jgi:endonuclease/exonuclease/phosphatase family metal-dependent hydrolase
MTIVLVTLTVLFGAAGPAAAEPLKVAAWNLQHLMSDGAEGCKPRTAADYRRLRRYAENLDADVVAFQEVENSEAARRVFDPDVYAIEMSRRPAEPGDECWHRPGHRYGPLRTGFAIRHGIAYERNPDVRAPSADGRNAVDVTLQLKKDTRLRLLSVHLASGCFANADDRAGDPVCATLHTQAERVESWLDARTRAGRAAAALGDFNRRLTLPDDGVWAELNDGTPASYALLTEGHRQVCRGQYEGAPYIDHIVVNPEARAKVVSDLLPLVYDETGEAAPSDHCPIAAGFRRF